MPSRDFGTLPRKSPHVHAVLERQTLICTRIECARAEPLTNIQEICCFFAEKVGQISKEIQEPKYFAKKKKKKSIRKRLGRGTLFACAKFQGLTSQKHREHWNLKEFGVLC